MPVSTLDSIPMTQNVRGKIIKMQGIAGVATYPEGRRKGFVKKLMKLALSDAKKDKITVFQLSFYGEPLVYSRLVEAVQFIKEHITDAVIQISTNAALLNKKLAKQLIEAGLSQFLVSIDGNNKTEFEEIRVGLKWDDVKNNVKDLHELIVSKNYPTELDI